MPWYGIRSVYFFGTKKNGKNVFEERVVCISASNAEEAHQKGLHEAKAYVKATGLVRHSSQIAYEQDGEPLIDQYEVWSELFEFAGTLEEFYKYRYEVFSYRPE